MVCVPLPTAGWEERSVGQGVDPGAGRVNLKKLKVPAPLLLKLTLPVGVLLVTTSVSLTVAAQVVSWPAPTDAGLQLTLVLVERLLTGTVVVPELPVWVVSPP